MAQILIVEDEKVTRRMVEEMMQQAGYQVQTAGSGEEGLACFVRGSFEVVLSDVNMPGMDGIEMIRRMRLADPTLAPVMMTSRQDQAVAVQALENGAVGFLTKPFSAAQLHREIARALSERRRRVDIHFLMGDLITERSNLDREMQARGRQLSQAELQRQVLEDQLITAQKLSALGELAPRIAHEFKVPLQLICGYTELALELLAAGENEEARGCVEQVLPAAQQLKELVGEISELGRPVVPKQEQLDLPLVLARVLDSLKPLGLVKHCQVVREFAATLPVIQGDPGQIAQVFRNLIVNAAQAMERSVRRVLTLSLGPSGDGRWLIAEVADSGPGIAPEHLERIFDPFFTTKTQGTGLGLPIVKSILNRHGAELRVESQEGKGTRFTAVFPVLDPAGGGAPERAIEA